MKNEHDLIQSVREMAAHRHGSLALPMRKAEAPAVVDVCAIRKALGYTQKQFADYFGFALSAIRDWEQGRRKPERSARILLTIIATNPQVVKQTLAQYPA